MPATEAGIANARLYEAAWQRERWIDESAAVTTALLSDGDLDDSLRIIAELLDGEPLFVADAAIASRCR